MSLTSMLRRPDVRERFSEEFPKPRLPLSSNRYVPPVNPTHAGRIGTAFDYVLRLHVAIINDSCWESPWIADKAVDRLERALSMGRYVFAPGPRRRTIGLLDRAKNILNDAHKEVDRCYESGRITTRALQISLLLAQLDEYFRCGFLSVDFGRTAKGDVDDLRSLLKVARSVKEPNPFRAEKVCVLNPTFRAGSTLVRGADADLLVDDTLIDIKVSKHLQFTAEMFRQLLGYFVLYKIGGGVTEGVRPTPKIRNIGIYFARYGVFMKIAIDAVLDRKTFPGFMRWFEQRARRMSTPVVTIHDDGTFDISFG